MRRPDSELNDNTVVNGPPNIALRIDSVTDPVLCDRMGYTYLAATSINVAFLPPVLDRLLFSLISMVRPQEAQAIAAGCAMPTTPCPWIRAITRR